MGSNYGTGVLGVMSWHKGIRSYDLQTSATLGLSFVVLFSICMFLVLRDGGLGYISHRRDIRMHLELFSITFTI